MILTLNFAVLAIWYFTSLPVARRPRSVTRHHTIRHFRVTRKTQLPALKLLSRPQRNASRQPPNTAEEKSIRESSPSDIQEELRTYPLGTKPIGQPVNTSQRLAAMRFSSHIFASDKDLRMVVVDGRRMIEGDTFGGGIHLHQITEDGVVFEYRWERYPIDILSQWDN